MSETSPWSPDAGGDGQGVLMETSWRWKMSLVMVWMEDEQSCLSRGGERGRTAVGVGRLESCTGAERERFQTVERSKVIAALYHGRRVREREAVK